MTPENSTVRSRLWVAVIGFVVLLGIGLVLRESAVDDDNANSNVDSQEPDEFIGEIIASEELILTMMPHLRRISSSAMDLRIPNHRSSYLFEPEVVVNDLSIDSIPGQETQPASTPVVFRQWTVDDAERAVPSDQLDLWRPFLEGVEYFEHAGFTLIRGRFLDGQADRWETDIGFGGLARTSSGVWSAVKAKLTARWHKQSQQEASSKPLWRIAKWKLENLSTQEAEHRWFTEALDAAIPDAADRQRARDSIHERLVTEVATLGEKAAGYHEHFDPTSHDRHPAVSVVDIDRDGFDDLYVMARWGKNQLLRNRGDGTFEEIAAEWKLDIEDHCSCALFADVDNDGDDDLFLGRTLEKSMFLLNDNGQFVDRSQELVSTPLPYLVSSIAAADYNNDGLLDVYFSTYAVHMAPHAVQHFLTKEQHPKYWEFYDAEMDSTQRIEASPNYGDSNYFHSPGPPNLLLTNSGGGRFSIVPETEQLTVWRNTYQSTWGDFDNDGDADLYLANDYAPNKLFRNDQGTSFVDITEQTGTEDIGFGMGAAWGDYDNDGRQDLYVSNMYSKAGQRITSQIPGLDRRVAGMAGGNSLFRNAGEPFEKVSGVEPPALQVEKAGWAWAGQFVDVNNDGFLDIYSLSGYYTAPAAIAIAEADR